MFSHKVSISDWAWAMSLELDIPSLLNAFDDEMRGGVDLREDDDPNNAYRRIRDARNEARDEERQGDLDGEYPAKATGLWKDVWDDGQDYLEQTAKDLEILAYMIEASVRLAGFPGLSQALDLTRELLENFWGDLLPAPDEDGIETTILPISRLNGDVINYPMMRVPMTEDTSVGEFVVWQYTQAKQLEGLAPEEREQRVAHGAVTMELFGRAVAETSDGFYQNLTQEIETAKQSLNALNSTFAEKAGEEFSPNLSRFTSGLSEAESTVRSVAGDRSAFAESNEEDTGDAGDAGTNTEASNSGQTTQSGPKGGISNRNDAIEMLEKIAVWFEKHEPQSILPSEIRKAKRRARMTPEQLYMDLITDEDVRRGLFKDVGIETKSDEEEY